MRHHAQVRPNPRPARFSRFSWLLVALGAVLAVAVIASISLWFTLFGPAWIHSDTSGCDWDHGCEELMDPGFDQPESLEDHRLAGGDDSVSSVYDDEPDLSGGRFIAHEWGTFTHFVGVDGSQLPWEPFFDGSDLPEFVHSQDYLGRSVSVGSKRGYSELHIFDREVVRMETPVIYFHTHLPRTISVDISFPNGLITEWYPRAEVGTWGHGMSWPSVQLLADDAEPDFPFDSANAQSHYYPARRTNAVPVKVPGESPDADEVEKLLFYRGLGTFALPALLQEGDDKGFTVTNTGKSELPVAILYARHKGRSGFTIRRELGPNESTQIHPPKLVESGTESIRRALRMELQAAGLFHLEAAAMVDTWHDHWFEEGTRLLYLLPRRRTDALLGLDIEPKPDELVRVMVVRSEIVTRAESREALWQLNRWVNEGSIDSAAARFVDNHGIRAVPVFAEITRRFFRGTGRKQLELYRIAIAREHLEAVEEKLPQHWTR